MYVAIIYVTHVIRLFIHTLYVDINECTLNIDDCDQVCVNDLGSYHCECDTGYFRETSSCVG